MISSKVLQDSRCKSAIKAEPKEAKLYLDSRSKLARFWDLQRHCRYMMNFPDYLAKSEMPSLLSRSVSHQVVFQEKIFALFGLTVHSYIWKLRISSPLSEKLKQQDKSADKDISEARQTLQRRNSNTADNKRAEQELPGLLYAHLGI